MQQLMKRWEGGQRGRVLKLALSLKKRNKKRKAEKNRRQAIAFALNKSSNKMSIKLQQICV